MYSYTYSLEFSAKNAPMAKAALRQYFVGLLHYLDRVLFALLFALNNIIVL